MMHSTSPVSSVVADECAPVRGFPGGGALPGQVAMAKKMEAMIRVDHAGEYGAMRIYAGQRAFTRDAATRALIEHMAEQEQVHLDGFNRLIVERRVRPTALLPLWHVGGFALGAVTAWLGPKAAMACTEAVETVIDAHYAEQQAQLPPQEDALALMIAQYRADEQEHHDTAIAEGAKEAPLHPVLTAAIRGITRAAIALSTRI